MPDDDIPLIPPVPAALREASQLGKLIPFVGAGASRLAGCPTWSQFADGTLQFFVDSGKFSYAQVEQLKELHPRIKLSLAMGFQKKFNLTVDFRSLLQRRDWEDDVNGRRLYSSLSKIGKTFVTTNYDEWLDKEIAPRARTIQDAEKPPDAAIKQRYVVHPYQVFIAGHLLHRHRRQGLARCVSRLRHRMPDRGCGLARPCAGNGPLRAVGCLEKQVLLACAFTGRGRLPSPLAASGWDRLSTAFRYYATIRLLSSRRHLVSRFSMATAWRRKPRGLLG